MKPPAEDSRAPLSDHIATGAVSAVAATVTLCAYPLVLAGIGGDPQPVVMYSHIFSRIGLAVIVVAATFGFIVGSERMAGVFGFFWGTHSIWEEEWAQRLGVMLAIAAVIAVSIYAAN